MNHLERPLRLSIITSLMLRPSLAYSATCVHLEKYQQDFEELICINDHLMVAVRDGKQGFINGHGQIITLFEYNNAHLVSKDIICIEKAGKYGLMNSTGKMILPPTYDHIAYFSEDLSHISNPIPHTC